MGLNIIIVIIVMSRAAASCRGDHDDHKKKAHTIFTITHTRITLVVVVEDIMILVN